MESATGVRKDKPAVVAVKRQASSDVDQLRPIVEIKCQENVERPFVVAPIAGKRSLRVKAKGISCGSKQCTTGHQSYFEVQVPTVALAPNSQLRRWDTLK